MNCNINGIGVYGPGFSNWPSLCQQWIQADNQETETTIAPKPELIPARERRRSPLCVRLAIEVAAQACAQTQQNISEMACVFGSSMGDTSITDYMCRTLASESKLLSPTKFHNSVHNAAAGYWSISTGCRAPVNSVSAFELTTPIALLEAAIACMVEQRPVLLVLFDIETPATFADFLPVSHSFAAALVLTPQNASTSTVTETSLAALKLSIESKSSEWPTLSNALQSKTLRSLYYNNPSARVLAMLHPGRFDECSTIEMPLGKATTLVISINPSLKTN